MLFGERLKHLRKSQGLSQAKIAEKLGVSVNAVCRWEKGETQPKGGHLWDLAKLLNTQVSFLLHGKTQHRNLDINNKETMMMAVRFIEERGRLGLSQEDLAQRLGIDIEELQRYEFQHEEIPLNLLRAMTSLQFDVGYILGGVRLKALGGAHSVHQEATGNLNSVVNMNVGNKE